jgi:hypothetical protein
VDGASPGSPNGWLTCHGDEQYSSTLPQRLEVRA